MKCPSCKQTASSFRRYVFTLQGVPFAKAIRGNLTCQDCGTFLRIISFGKQFYVIFFVTGAVLFGFITFFRRLVVLFGWNAVALCWVLFIFLVMFFVPYYLWKNAILEKVDTSA